jgi:hypothetical protein
MIRRNIVSVLAVNELVVMMILGRGTRSREHLRSTLLANELDNIPISLCAASTFVGLVMTGNVLPFEALSARHHR